MFWVVKLHAKIEKIYEITAWFCKINIRSWQFETRPQVQLASAKLAICRCTILIVLIACYFTFIIQGSVSLLFFDDLGLPS